HEVTLLCDPDSTALAPPGAHCVVLGEDSADEVALERDIDVLVRLDPRQLEQSQFPLARQVVLICDLGHEYWPNMLPPAAMGKRLLHVKEALEQAGALLALSENTRRDILHHPATKCRCIWVTTPALPGEEPGPASPEELERVPAGRYFLCPGSLGAFKN